MLSEQGYRVTATDNLGNRPPEKRREQAAEINDWAAEYGVEFRIEDALVPEGFERDAYDTVICLDVIEHVGRPRALLETAKHSLSSGGSLVLLTPNGVDLAKRLRVLVGLRHGPRVEELFRQGAFRGHVKEYTPSELEHILDLGGFDLRDR